MTTIYFFNEKVNLGEDTIFVFDYIMKINSCFIIGKSYYNYIKVESGLASIFYRDIYNRFLTITNKIESVLTKK